MAVPLTAAERADIAAALLGNAQNWHHFQDDVIPRYEATVRALEVERAQAAPVLAAVEAWKLNATVESVIALGDAYAIWRAAREG